MARGKRVSSKVQAIADSLLNDIEEPRFTALTSSQSDLIRGLNYYSHFSDMSHSRKWAIEWARKNMPDIVSNLEKVDPCWFNNTGFVLRMVQNGFVLDETEISRIRNRLTEISKMARPSEEKKIPKVRKVKEEFNEVWENYDYAIDDILCGREPRKFSLGTNRKHQAEVLAACEADLKEIDEAPEYYAPETIQPLKKFLSEIKKQLEAVMRQQRAVRKVSPRKVKNPAKMVSKMKFKRKDEVLGLESMRPETLIGARQAIVYDSKHRFLLYFKSLTEEGFTVSGSTLKNFDTEKSFFKKIRKPEEMANSIKGLSLAEIRKFLSNMIKGKEFACKGRFNENMLILKVSN